MTDTIDQAAAAFAENMGEISTPSPAGVKDAKGAPELVFGNSDKIEGDIPFGGGDDTPSAEEKAAAKAAKRRAREGDDEDDEDLLEFEDEDEDDEEDLDGDEEDDEDDEEDEDDDDEFLDRKFTVMVDGKEEEITVKDALDGVIRTKTFHRRLNELDGYRTELGKHAERIVEDRKRHDEMLAEAEELMKSIIPEEPNWDELFEKDPKSARALQKQFNDLHAKVADIRAKREKSSKDLADQTKKERIEYAQTEFPKFQRYANWKSQDDMQKDIKAMRRTAMALGFSEEEVGEVLDSRMLIVLHKASKYDRMMAAKPRAKSRGKTPVKPGAGSSKRTARRGITESQKRLAKSGGIDDATEVFGQILKNSR